ncbi:MAG: amino acid--tRNA ligase-related protein [Patescibacteria group bacterium]
MERTLAAETLQKIGKKVTLKGWVGTVRDHGKITFLDLRDSSGLVQCVGQNFPKLTNESVVEVQGEVAARPAKLVNLNLPTGKVEVKIAEIKILSLAKEQLPLPVSGDGREIDEEVRLKYRYLDLRRERLQRNLRVRSEYVQAARKYLFSQGFVEIETPYLSKSTPEGSRDFVVPSRKHPGKFYALPQAPQQYKQLLMVAGFEKYFQIARAFRDEDLRADRGFEHTQIDLEMSFVERGDVMGLVEGMTIAAAEAVGAKIAKKPFPVLTYQDSIKKYGDDKFDLRNEKEKKEGVLSFAWVVDFPFFKKDAEGKWTFTHNPFSAPKTAEDEKNLLAGKDIENILTSQYDLVCNGMEVAGGSIRAHNPKVLQATYKIMGYSENQMQESVGHMLEAFSYGAPPHGGCAQGFERLLMAYLGENYIREIQAFPMTGRGRTSVMDAPSEITPKQLKELGISIVGSKEKINLPPNRRKPPKRR